MSGDEILPKTGPANSGNLILIGMMATGKSSVGAMLAEQLGYELVDLDHVIIRKEGRSVPDIFAEDGEAYFRAVETEVLRETLRGGRKVISTGGGAVLAPANREMMMENGIVAALSATAEAIISRVAEDNNRPLLAGNTEERVRRILEERKDAYSFAHCTVDTTNLTAAQVCHHILMHYRVLAFKHVG
ncbi:shikimate kinase [Paenibacillus durus]|uniref:Shikimate kinase n=1 Tax=Paenibacillus durus ATCC 35681 TaxID=1333534 RepID=A0A0F7F8E0_PAEDU|nr:shikimate kinase [Paenibacillus durus]AKG34487.1 shikimate kinase [Paenibacillus durus ATCC 35681]